MVGTPINSTLGRLRQEVCSAKAHLKENKSHGERRMGENGESCREELGAEGNRDLAERGKQA